jgi:hypothetical protein
VQRGHGSDDSQCSRGDGDLGGGALQRTNQLAVAVEIAARLGLEADV